MNRKITVSIGIPAYNEEDNIMFLLDSLLKQKEEYISIKEILVFTDGSTDKTVSLIKSIKNKKIKLKVGTSRKGQQFRQNEILKYYTGDIIVLLEADILPVDDKTIEKLTKPFLNGESRKLGMVVGIPIVIKPNGFYEKILAHGYEMKYKIFSAWNDGQNVYACGGHSMKALSREFSEKIKWPINVPEDAYTYLLLKKLGYKMLREKEAKAYMRNVTNLKDRVKQVNKFRSGKKSLSMFFPQDFIDKEYSLPKNLVVKNLIVSMFRNPIMIFLYIIEIILNRLLTIKANKFNAIYLPYKTSKILVQIGKERRINEV